MKRNVLLPVSAALLVAGSLSAQTFTVLHHFASGGDGQFPAAVPISDGARLYGMSDTRVFRINPDGTDFTVLYTLGSNPVGPGVRGGLALSGSTLYGTVNPVGSYPYGMLFKLNTDGGDYAVLKGFGGTNGTVSSGAPVVSGSWLYGTTLTGGSFDCGTVYRVDTDGGNFTFLKEFDGANGGSPKRLVLSGNVLYGTSAGGGANDMGTVFKINTDGSGFAVLHSFAPGTGYPSYTNSDGMYPEGGLLLAGATLYGTTAWGGTNGMGTVFKIDTDGGNFGVLHTFAPATGWLPINSDGIHARGDLALCGAMLYGAAGSGGNYGYGTVFMLSTNGGSFWVLHTFAGGPDDGRDPSAGMGLSGSLLYGTTAGGGSNFNSGVLFSLSVPSPTFVAAPLSHTAEAGTTVGFQARAEGLAPLSYQWLCHGTNVLDVKSPRLQLTNVQSVHAGSYAAIVSNMLGAVTSAPAMLDVIVPVDRRPVPGIQLTGEAGSTLNVERADALGAPANWQLMDTVSLTNTAKFCFDVSKPFPPERFYRAWQTGTPSVPPSLKLIATAAITLTGAVGASLRLDYINAIGPTGAWVTLDTVRLTNTVQLYFDVTVAGQPTRLYRIVPVP